MADMTHAQHKFNPAAKAQADLLSPPELLKAALGPVLVRKNVPDKPHVARPWGYKGTMKLAEHRPAAGNQFHVKVWVRCPCRPGPVLIELRHSDKCPQCGGPTTHEK